MDELTEALTGSPAVDALRDVVLAHPIGLVANALGPAPNTLIERARAASVPVAGLLGHPGHALHQLEAGVDVLVC
jgi:NAD(P)H-dependent flavin oxidoreductase YrpB (nitropropane dioxygenase family)